MKIKFVMKNELFLKEGNLNFLLIIERSGNEISLYCGRYFYVVVWKCCKKVIFYVVVCFK